MQKQKGVSILVGIVIIIAVAVVAVGGVFVYQYFATPKANNQTQVQNQPDLTVDWKTYTNTQYGFEFKYPKEFIDKDNFIEFKGKDCSSVAQNFFFKNYGSFPIFESGGTGGSMTAEILCLSDNLGGESVKSLMDYLRKNIEEEKYGMMTFSDISKVNVGENNYKFSTFSLGHQDIHILIGLKDNLILILSLGYYQNYNTGENLVIPNLDRINSTFKFTK